MRACRACHRLPNLLLELYRSCIDATVLTSILQTFERTPRSELT
jgi:hypothetical protein